MPNPWAIFILLFPLAAMNPNDRTFEECTVGERASFDRTWGEQDVLDFARLSGDINPLHLDEEYAGTTKFGRRIVYGMLVGSMCSMFVGTILPGKRCLYVSQTLSFKSPVYIGDTTTLTGEIVHKSPATRLLEIAISIRRDEVEVMRGTAIVQIL